MNIGVLPARACGACVVCCVELEIEVPEFSKGAGTACRHLTKGGCAIYESRPGVCRNWLCGWRLIPGLPENWRPDLSGVLVFQQPCAQPEYGATALVAALMRPRENIHDPVLQGFVNAMANVRVPVYLKLLQQGKGNLSVFLNPQLETTARSPADILAVLQSAVAQLGG